jgi:hypothetical protein
MPTNQTKPITTPPSRASRRRDRSRLTKIDRLRRVMEYRRKLDAVRRTSEV